MGWSSGTNLIRGIIETLQENVKSSETRTEVYVNIIPLFEDRDWDNHDEVEGIDPAFDAAMKELYPEMKFSPYGK